MIEELPKLRAFKPERYVLATSVQLSPANKQSLVNDLEPFLKGPEDVYGAAELNGMIRRHPQVERAHFKLWISSTSVLERVLHADIFNVTEATVESIKGQMARLVVHDGYDRARAILEEHHHCVIAGNPGIGKSTLARMLMCDYLQLGFTPIVVVGDVADAWSTITAARTNQQKFVVFYDDFLGTSRFDEAKFSKNEDASLLRFIDSARRATNLRFILTTREYIMADARRLHRTFSREADRLAQCTILLGDYSQVILRTGALQSSVLLEPAGISTARNLLHHGLPRPCFAPALQSACHRVDCHACEQRIADRRSVHRVSAPQIR